MRSLWGVEFLYGSDIHRIDAENREVLGELQELTIRVPFDKRWKCKFVVEKWAKSSSYNYVFFVTYSSTDLWCYCNRNYCKSANKCSKLTVWSMTPALALSFNPHGVIKVVCKAYRVLVTLRNVEQRSRSSLLYLDVIKLSYKSKKNRVIAQNIIFLIIDRRHFTFIPLASLRNWVIPRQAFTFKVQAMSIVSSTANWRLGMWKRINLLLSAQRSLTTLRSLTKRHGKVPPPFLCPPGNAQSPRGCRIVKRNPLLSEQKRSLSSPP